jgi:hypothetical protein
MNPKEIVSKVDSLDLSGISNLQMVDPCEDGKEPFDSTKGGEFLGY